MSVVQLDAVVAYADSTYADSTEDKERMDLLRQCCSLYQGNHPFHNYTKRRLYRVPAVETATGEQGLPAGTKQTMCLITE